MKFKEIVDFMDIFDNEKYVVDWEQLDDYPFFKDLSQTLIYHKEIVGKLEALKALQAVLDGRSISHFLTNEALKSFLKRNEAEIETTLSYEANALQVPFDEFLEDKYLQDEVDRLDYVLRQQAEQIEEAFDANKLVFKKGWFREPENEAFYDEIIKRLPYSEVLENFYNMTEEGNRADLYTQFGIFLKKYFNDGDLEKIYMKHSGAVATNCDTDNDELSIDNLNASMRQMVMESILYASQMAFDEEYAQKELEFYKVEIHTDEEQRDAEAHGEYEDIRSTNQSHTRRQR